MILKTIPWQKNKINSLNTDLQQIKENILLPAHNKLDAIKNKANAINFSFTYRAR